MTTREPSSRNPAIEAGRKQVSLMHVFRSAFERGDARDGRANYVDGDRELSIRSKERREGTNEETLRRHLNYDMASLMNTISLDAVLDLDDHPFIRDSIINFGFGDLSEMNNTVAAGTEIAKLIRETLIRNEPRLIAETIEIQLDHDAQGTTQRLSFRIAAEMVATPVDIPLDFVAEVDMGAGKIQMTRLRVAT
jgi:type VI secretion system protein ImpF